MHHVPRWRSRLAVVTLGASTVLVAVAPPSLAYCRTNIVHATRGSTVWHTTTVPSSWGGAIQASVNSWNGKANWTFRYVPYGQYGPYYGAVYRASFRSKGFSDVPGYTPYTLRSGSSTQAVDHALWLNSDFKWNLSGTMSQANRQVDVRTITTHELGHFFVLTHPNLCGAMTTAETNAVMTPNWRTKWTPNSDDIAGLKAMHGSAPSSAATDLSPDLNFEDVLTDAPAIPADVESAS